MSRIGRKPVVVPKGVTLQVDGNTVAVKGPRGSCAARSMRTWRSR